MLADLFNGTLEFIGALFIIGNIFRIVKDKQLKGYNLSATAFFSLWGFWNCYFYPSLDQWISFWGGLVMVTMNTSWIVLAIHYGRKNRKPKRGHGDWMLTATGRQYWPADPKPTDVDIFDIARHLSMLCRFTGACQEFYSVAEHSVYVSRLVPEEHALTALLHDATEAYIADINRPTKQSLPDYKALEDLNWKQAIAPAFGLPLELPECIHVADRAVGRAEQQQIMPPMPGRDAYTGTPAANIKIECMPPKLAERMFIERYMELQRRRREAVDQGFSRVSSRGLLKPNGELVGTYFGGL
jgi:hypothetical protein